MNLQAIDKPPQILLGKYETGIAEFVKQCFAKPGYQIEHVSDGVSGLRSILKNSCDLVLLHLMLPKLNGLELLQQLRQGENTIPVIILSPKVDWGDRLIGFESGADNYMSKPFFVGEPIAKMNVIMGRRLSAPLPQNPTDSRLTFNLVTRKVLWFDVGTVFSLREFSLVQYFMQIPGHIFTRQQILKNVWGISIDFETNVLDVCVQRIKRKLRRNNSPRYGPIESMRCVGCRIKAQAHV